MTPFKRERYPADWKVISTAVRERSGGQCECMGECGLHHEHRCNELNGRAAMWARGKVVLTVAHLNHDTTDNTSANLKAMCQRCHLRYDAKHHAHNAAVTRRSKLIAQGQAELIL